MSTYFLVTICSLFHYIHGQTDNETSHCINELEVITEQIQLNLSNPSGIPPNYSVATSASYHANTSTILIAGDFFYIDNKDATNRSYYSFVQSFSHSNNHSFTLLYSIYAPFTNPSFGNKFVSHQSLRSWSRVIAHPSLPYFYLFGINNLTQYNVNNGQFMWTADIKPCSDQHHVNTQPLIYNDATFLKSDPYNIIIGGSCVNDSGKTVIVLDEYNIKTGAYNDAFRQTYNLTELGFIKEIHLLDGFGLVPPEVTVSAPINPLTDSVVDKYFYVGFNHLIFNGIARIEHDTVSNDWRVKKWPEHWTLVNPSFVLHRSIVTTDKGLIGLLDPSINGVLSLFTGKMKHLTRWDTLKVLDELDEHNKYNTFTWYGGHEKYDLHLDWTLSMDTIQHKYVYVTAAPLSLPSVKSSTIAKHNIENGEVIAGAKVSFFALDTIVTNDDTLISVGFKMDAFDDALELSPSDILPYLKRKAVFGVFSNDVKDTTSCIGCDIDFYGDKCISECSNCLNGYCSDDLVGNGDCYCTIMSYGTNCSLCDGDNGSCDPLKGICNSGPNNDGTCKFCYDLEIEIAQNITDSTFHIGLGDHYGPQCTDNCSCNAQNGLCFTIGNDNDTRAGHCLYCTNSSVWGKDCNKECECDDKTEYCSNGVDGTGCVKYDYGGLLNDKKWPFYTVIATALFVVLFSITFWNSNKQYKRNNNGKSMPFCPKKDRNNNDNYNDDNDEYYNDNNDLRQSMIKDKNIQNDPNEPPAISHIVQHKDKEEPQTYNI